MRRYNPEFRALLPTRLSLIYPQHLVFELIDQTVQITAISLLCTHSLLKDAISKADKTALALVMRAVESTLRGFRSNEPFNMVFQPLIYGYLDARAISTLEDSDLVQHQEAGKTAKDDSTIPRVDLDIRLLVHSLILAQTIGANSVVKLLQDELRSSFHNVIFKIPQLRMIAQAGTLTEEFLSEWIFEWDKAGTKSKNAVHIHDTVVEHAVMKISDLEDLVRDRLKDYHTTPVAIKLEQALRKVSVNKKVREDTKEDTAAINDVITPPEPTEVQQSRVNGAADEEASETAAAEGVQQAYDDAAAQSPRLAKGRKRPARDTSRFRITGKRSKTTATTPTSEAIVHIPAAGTTAATFKASRQVVRQELAGIIAGSSDLSAPVAHRKRKLERPAAPKKAAAKPSKPNPKMPYMTARKIKPGELRKSTAWERAWAKGARAGAVIQVKAKPKKPRRMDRAPARRVTGSSMADADSDRTGTKTADSTGTTVSSANDLVGNTAPANTTNTVPAGAQTAPMRRAILLRVLGRHLIALVRFELQGKLASTLPDSWVASMFRPV